jgi:hypothetical protein
VADVMTSKTSLANPIIAQSIKTTDTLRKAVELMAKTDLELLQVEDAQTHQPIGTLSYKDI